MVGHNPQFTYRKDGVFYFSRRIPKDIRHQYEHDRLVMCLRTKSRVIAGKSARAIAARIDEYWMSLRIADLNIPNMLPVNGQVSAETVITLQQALQNYHSLKGTGKDDLFFRSSERFVRYVIEGLGDRPLDRYTSADAAAFRDQLFEKGLSCDNAFAQTFIPDRNDVTKRLPIPIDRLRLIQETCRKTDDDLRWLIALISDSGMRLAEAAGLLKADMKMDHDIPHVSLKPHAWRQLKTANSERVIPLVGTSLWAARRILECTDSEFAFPRFTNTARCNSNSASATLNKWMRPFLPDGCVIHSFRHSLRDRLRAVETPSEIADVLGGWTSKSVVQSYGTGYDLPVLQRWMKRLEGHL
jgi:integrase